MTRSGFVMMLLLAAGPAMAQPIVTLPEGLPGADSEFVPGPDCHGGGSPLGVVRDGKVFMPQPYARDPVVYGGIYLGVEQHFAPLARFFFPRLQVLENQRDWIRITRTTRNGAKPADHLTLNGTNYNLRGVTGPVPVIVKIDKCTGAILEMSWDQDKLR